MWTIVPDVGILEEGGSATVSITGKLFSNLNGLTKAQFKAESRMSGNFALAMVNTTFYYCVEVSWRALFRTFLYFRFCLVLFGSVWFDAVHVGLLVFGLPFRCRELGITLRMFMRRFRMLTKPVTTKRNRVRISVLTGANRNTRFFFSPCNCCRSIRSPVGDPSRLFTTLALPMLGPPCVWLSLSLPTS